MPTITGTTSTDLALALRTTYTTPLLANIVANTNITAADINSLAAFTTAVMNHTHTLTEYTEIHEYGNTSTNISINTVTSTPIEPSFSWANVSVGDTILASQYSSLSAAANNMVNHIHTFSDSY